MIMFVANKYGSRDLLCGARNLVGVGVPAPVGLLSAVLTASPTALKILKLCRLLSDF